MPLPFQNPPSPMLLFLSGMSGCLHSCLAVVCVGPFVFLWARWLIAIMCCSRKWKARKRPFVVQVRNEKEWPFPTAYRKKILQFWWFRVACRELNFIL